VSVVRHREEKAGDPARGGEKARPGGGFCVSPPLLAPWTRLDRRPWGQDGGLSAPGTPSFAPWDVGVDHEPERFPKHGRAFPRGRGGSRRLGRLRPDCLADSGQEGQVEGRLSDSPQYQGAVKETPRCLSHFDFLVPELCPVWRRGWEGSCPLATPRQGMQGQDEALHRFWRGLTLVELWGPRPWVPPYPGPRDIKGERRGQGGVREGVSARFKAIWKGILQPGATRSSSAAHGGGHKAPAGGSQGGGALGRVLVGSAVYLEGELRPRSGRLVVRRWEPAHLWDDPQ
jgi:hypothetical protein